MPARCQQNAGITDSEAGMATTQEKNLELEKVYDSLRQPLGLVENPERRADLERLVQGSRIYLERALFALLIDVVQTVNAAEGSVRARLEYLAEGAKLVVEPQGEGAAEESPKFFDAGGEFEKVTIRLPNELKELINQAAKLGGTSVNGWYIRELGRTIGRQVRDEMRHNRRESGRHGGGMHGYVGD